MIDNPGFVTIPIIPPDMAKMRTYLGQPIPQPSTEHTLVKCRQCGGDGWVGPAQLLHYTFNGGELLCYRCLFKAMGEQSTLPVEILALDQSADEKPRRT